MKSNRHLKLMMVSCTECIWTSVTANILKTGEIPISANSSNASYSAHNLVAELVELPAERTVNTLHSFSDDPERVKHRDRPFSVPCQEEQKTVLMRIRQSVPSRLAPGGIPEVGYIADLLRTFPLTVREQNVVPLITDDLEQCEEEPVNDTQQAILPPVEPQPEHVGDATSKSLTASISVDRAEWAASVADRVLSAEKKDDWATSIAARVLSAPEDTETQDRPQSSLELTPASRVVSIASGKSSNSYLQ